MAEYIEREKTVELLRSLGNREYRKENGTIQEAIKMISYPEYTPTADVAPVVHGCFEPCFDENGNWRQGFAKCSNCGKEYYAQVINHFGFCPNCGAKMDGGVSDEAD
jgi:hypothetical protein